MDSTSTKARVLEAAAAVFLRHGFAAASMDQVRQEAGVSNGSLYHHFPTKAQLADALYANTLRDFHATVLEAAGGRTSAQNGVKAMVRAYANWVVQHPDRAQLLQELRRTGGATAGDAETSAANAEGFGGLQAWVERHVEAGAMRPMPFAVWTAVVFSPSMALTGHWIRQVPPEVSPRTRAALEHAAWMGVAA